MKRNLLTFAFAAGASALVFGSVGCGSIKLSASEHDKIAEYAAYVLLNNFDSYDDKLLSKEEIDKITAERELAEKLKEEMENANRPTTSSGESPTSSGGNGSGSGNGNGGNGSGTGSGNGGNGGGTVQDKTIDDIMNIENISIQYAGYEFCGMYPDDPSEFVVMKAASGKKFAVLSFVFQNTSDKSTECNILNRDIIYRLNLSNGNVYRSQITTLTSDFTTWKGKISPKGMEMAFMVFEVPDTLTEQDFVDAELSFRENGVTQSVRLK